MIPDSPGAMPKRPSAKHRLQFGTPYSQWLLLGSSTSVITKMWAENSLNRLRICELFQKDSKVTEYSNRFNPLSHFVTPFPLSQESRFMPLKPYKEISNQHGET